MSRDLAPSARCLTVWTASSLAAALLGAWLVPDLEGALRQPPEHFDGWLVLGCEAVALLATGWLWLLVTLVSLEAAGRTRPRRGVPRTLRRLVLAACGAGLVGGLVSPAYAVPLPSPLTGLPLPDRATSGPAPGPGATPAAPVAGPRDRDGRAPRTLRVVPGDTLWALALSDLPQDASPAEVDEHWRTIHAANREVIGDDPDLILPGQELRLPPAPPPAT